MSNKRWTSGQLERLKEQYGKMSNKDLAQELCRSVGAIRNKASALNLAEGKNVWADDEIGFLQENYLKLGAKEVSARLGRTVSAVHTKIREVGGGREAIGPRVEWTQSELDYLRKHYQFKSQFEISNHLGRTENAIHRRASILGLQHYVEPFPFFEKWAEENAYVIGFWAADGWATKRGSGSIRIAFCQKDPDIILVLKEMLPMGRIIHKATGMYQFYIQSVKVYEWLCGLFGHDVCRKSHTLQWPDIPSNFVKHFIRGAVDGDGSLFKTRDGLWSFSYATSSKDFIDRLVSVLYEETGVHLGVGLNKIGVWHARVTGVGAVCLADWLYRDAEIALERKAWIAREMMETRGLAQSKSISPKRWEVFPHILSEYKTI